MRHAKLSPSAAERWMSCPGSVHLAPDVSSTGASSVYAENGTAMHEVAEMCLRKNIAPQSFIGKTVNARVVTAAMVEIIQVYVHYIRSLSGQKFYEEKVTLAAVINDCYGTADCIVFENNTMRVIDFKTGGGFLVEAENNKQLMCYALGAYIKYSPVYDITAIALTIVQPPKGNIDACIITLDELVAFAESLKLAYAAIQNEPDKFVPSTAACKWCPAKASCPALARLANAAAAIDFRSITIETLDEWLTALPLLNMFITAVEAKAKDILLSGGTIFGWKVVEGRKTRTWADEQAAEIWLKNKGYKNIYTTPVLLSIAQIEIALKEEHLDLTALTAVRFGHPTIVKETDPRVSVDKNLSAKKDFGG